MNARRDALLQVIERRGGVTLAQARDFYRLQGWLPGDADVDLSALESAGDVTAVGQAGARMWTVNTARPAWLDGGTS